MAQKLVDLVNLVNSSKFSSAIFTDTPKTFLEYALTVDYSPNFSLPIAFTCMVRQNFPPPNSYFCASVYGTSTPKLTQNVFALFSKFLITAVQ